MDIKQDWYGGCWNLLELYRNDVEDVNEMIERNSSKAFHMAKFKAMWLETKSSENWYFRVFADCVS